MPLGKGGYTMIHFVIPVIVGFVCYVIGRIGWKDEKRKQEQRDADLNEEKQAQIQKRSEILKVLKSGEEGNRECYALCHDKKLNGWLYYTSAIKRQSLPFNLAWISVTREEIETLIERYEHFESARCWLKEMRNPAGLDWTSWKVSFMVELQYLNVSIEFFGTSEQEIADLRKEHHKSEAKRLVFVAQLKMSELIAILLAMSYALEECGEEPADLFTSEQGIFLKSVDSILLANKPPQ